MRAAIAKYQKLGDINNGNLLSPSSGDYRSKIKASVGSPETFFLDL